LEGEGEEEEEEEEFPLSSGRGAMINVDDRFISFCSVAC